MTPPDPCDALYLSPHLDDVVLSCSARLLAEVAAGQRVRVVTVMSAGGGRPEAEGVYARRREEDRQALGSLGAKAEWLDLPDAPWRRSYYRTFRTITFGEHPQDRAFAAEVAERIGELWRRFLPQRIYLPLGVGSHVDHRWVHRAWRRLPNEALVFFYEDRPYVFVAESVRLRLGEIGARLLDTPPDLTSQPFPQIRRAFFQSLRETHYLRTFLPPGLERLRCARMLVRRFASGQATQMGAGPILRPELERTDGDGFERIVTAVACYRSQLSDLFGDVAGLRRAMTAYARRLDPRSLHAERYWELRAPAAEP
ncbi:MAG: PIG-L family deacetylase [bacterium]|nr:PIG-L family deacetylase [bacterium]